MMRLLLGMTICCFSSPVFAALTRSQTIDREIHCIQNHMAKGESAWGDVCHASDSVQDPPALAQVQAVSDQAESASSDGTVGASSRTMEQQSQPEPIPQPYVWGTETGVAQEKDNLGQRKAHTLDVAAGPYYNRYTEPKIDPVVYNIGTMIGYYGGYTYRPQNNILNNEVLNTYRLEGYYAQGKVNYKGSGLDKQKTDKMYELRALFGKEFALSDAYSSRLTTYLGFGYRFLFDAGNGRLSSDGHIGYDRRSHYFYVPVGAIVDVPTGKDTQISFNAEYDYFLQGTQKSYLSNGNQFTAPLLSNDVSNHQKRGYGVRGSVKFLKKLNPIDVYFEPFIRYWNIKDSKIANTTELGAGVSVLEPHNTTYEIGSKFGVQF